ncbi:Papain inhibitor [Grifola frondosa]|uniref:Papain inhibitor n=1 Tax=Grifola frondosa TaxID=5627 RepID=A0A1C7LV05_GRIFR|nr:Papain inhibitor [Grifola frondosa]
MFSKTLISTVLAAVFFGTANAYSGQATYFEPGLGACGAYSQPTDLIVALSPSEYVGGAHCYQHIGVNYNGNFVDATVVDECPGCASGSIDLSPSAFEQLAPLSAGRLYGVSWNYE